MCKILASSYIPNHIFQIIDQRKIIFVSIISTYYSLLYLFIVFNQAKNKTTQQTLKMNRAFYWPWLLDRTVGGALALAIEVLLHKDITLSAVQSKQIFFVYFAVERVVIPTFSLLISFITLLRKSIISRQTKLLTGL